MIDVVAAIVLGAFTTFGIPALGAAVLAPVAVAVVSATRPSAARTAALGIPVAVLVLANAGRILGAFFLVLHEHDRLPPTFALSAGWGDIAVAVLAIPVAWLAHRRAWLLIPGFLVPVYFLTHLALFARLLREIPARVALHAGH